MDLSPFPTNHRHVHLTFRRSEAKAHACFGDDPNTCAFGYVRHTREECLCCGGTKAGSRSDVLEGDWFRSGVEDSKVARAATLLFRIARNETLE